MKLANACRKCGDCYHPHIGPNTDGRPCDWCQDCGCHRSAHPALAPAETCLAGIVQPFSDSHACLCLLAEHDGATPHQCDECGSRWAG